MSEPKRMSEAEVEDLRERLVLLREHIATANDWSDAYDVYVAARKLLADRDAHLADLKEARDLLEEARSTTIMEQIADRLWERVDYFWERTK